MSIISRWRQFKAWCAKQWVSAMERITGKDRPLAVRASKGVLGAEPSAEVEGSSQRQQESVRQPAVKQKLAEYDQTSALVTLVGAWLEKKVPAGQKKVLPTTNKLDQLTQHLEQAARLGDKEFMQLRCYMASLLKSSGVTLHKAVEQIRDNDTKKKALSLLTPPGKDEVRQERYKLPQTEQSRGPTHPVGFQARRM